MGLPEVLMEPRELAERPRFIRPCACGSFESGCILRAGACGSRGMCGMCCRKAGPTSSTPDMPLPKLGNLGVLSLRAIHVLWAATHELQNCDIAMLLAQMWGISVG